MKKLVLIKCIFFILIICCFSVKAQYKNFNDYFFNNHITYYSLGRFINNNNIIIYDQSKKIAADDINYSCKENDVNKTIQIVHELPQERSYAFLTDYIINENLAVISFSSSNRKKYIVYTLKRNDSKSNWWEIISIYNGTMN